MLFVEFDFVIIYMIYHFTVCRFCIHLALLWSSFLIMPFFLNPTCDDITVISLLAAGINCGVICFFQRSHACAVSDLATRRLLPRETMRQITNSARASRVTPAQGWSTIRGETEMSGPSVWQQIEQWEIGVSVPLLEDLCSSACRLCVCVCVYFITPGHVSYSTRA